MWLKIPVYSTSTDLILQFGSLPPADRYEVTAICDRDSEGGLHGIELFLYEEPKIVFEKVREQFHGFENIYTEEHGMIYISLREEEAATRGPGFGRTAQVGIDKEGYLSLVHIAWSAPGAATPSVNPSVALAGLAHRIGEPQRP